MKVRKLATFLVIGASAAVSFAAFSQDAPAAPQTQGQGGWQSQRGGRGGGMGMGMGRGTVGTVTEAAADHYTIKTELGEIYTIHYSVNTRIVKQPAGQPGRGQTGAGSRARPRRRRRTHTPSGDQGHRHQSR
jgi:hypothetical protein